MYAVKLKIYRCHYEGDKAYEIDICYVKEDKLQARLKSWRENPHFYEVLDYWKI